MRGSVVGTALAGVALLAAAPAGLHGQDRCEFQEVVELTGPAAGELHINDGAGALEVNGRDGASEVRATATLCASDQDRLDALGVTLEGDRLETEYPEGGWGGRRSYARIDLDVEVPAGTDLRVEDRSGSVRIAGVGDVDLDDGSGEVILEDVGSAFIDDGSGSLRIDGASGEVTVTDGSGRVEIYGVSGDVTVSDGSGDVEIESVGGSVRMDRIGSGSVRVDDVEGDLVVTDGRRERIRYSNVRGEVDLPPARRRGRS